MPPEDKFSWRPKSQMGLATRIEILLATYNGARFLREQIDSLFDQDYDNLAILARDDGSTDHTVQILQEYAARVPDRFKLVEAARMNGGIVNNFVSLMNASTAGYVCFCDQDDVWLPDKVTKSKAIMDRLELKWGTKIPLLVFTDLRVVDENLNTVHASFWQRMNIDPEWARHLPRLLVSPAVTGCTVLANRALVDLALTMPREVLLHDLWLGLLASAMGKAAYLKEQTVLYRQHGRNAIGAGSDPVPPRRPLLDRLRQSLAIPKIDVDGWRDRQAEAQLLLEIHGAQLPPKSLKRLSAFRECNKNQHRLARVAIFIRNGFCSERGRPYQLAMLRHLWSNAEKQRQD